MSQWLKHLIFYPALFVVSAETLDVSIQLQLISWILEIFPQDRLAVTMLARAIYNDEYRTRNPESISYSRGFDDVSDSSVLFLILPLIFLSSITFPVDRHLSQIIPS